MPTTELRRACLACGGLVTRADRAGPKGPLPGTCASCRAAVPSTHRWCTRCGQFHHHKRCPSRPPGVTAHGYGGYTNGCTCDVCRAAKAAYVRERREAATRAGRSGAVVPGITHGRYGYEERGCRCDICTAARAAAH